jgi:hypothetical protein
MVGPNNSAKGNGLELLVIGSLMAKQWTIGQLLDVFLEPSEPRPAWCRDIADHVIKFHAHGTAREYGCEDDLEWLEKARVWDALATKISTGPGMWA